MKKLILGAAVSVAMFGGAAQAAITLDSNGIPVINPATTYEIFLSGSSASQPFIESLMTSTKIPAINKICDSSQLIYQFRDTGTVGKDQNAYLCVLNTNNPALSGLPAGKANLLLYKRNNGGSAQGVNPVVADAAIDFLKVDVPTNCTSVSTGVKGVSFSKINCAYTAGNALLSNAQKPDFGMSDVDPAQFFGQNTPSGFDPVAATDVDKLTVKSAAVLVFGVPVTKMLRNAMQEAQFGATSICVGKDDLACMPSLSSAQIASIFTGKLNSWKQLKLGATGNLFDNTSASNKPVGLNADRVHVCRRTNGSGTGAQFGIKFLNYPCSSVATPAASKTDGVPEAVEKAQIHENSSSGIVSECLSEMDSGTNSIAGSFDGSAYPGGRWAIGIQGTEHNANRAFSYRFIKVDGVEPTLDRVARGKYKDWVELTYQYNKTHAFDPSEKEVVEELIKQAGNPIVMAATNLNAIHTWGKSGFMAVPQSFAAPATGVLAYEKPVNPFSHGTTTEDPNACRMPAVYNPGTTGGIQFK
ncbi:MAG: hypothetical protein Q8N96_16405 [Methylovulum sp.]|nr:hypothetical protein [Methylovulum sp.]